MIRRILVPLDGSHLAESSLPHALALARSFHAELLLFRVVEMGSTDPVDSMDWRLYQAEAAAYLEALAKRLEGVPVRTRLAAGKAAEQITRLAADEQVDLVVITTHAEGGPSEFTLGGTIHKVLWGAGISALVVRPAEGGHGAHAGLQPVRYRRVLCPVDCSSRADWALRFAARVAGAHRAELCMAHVVTVPEIARRAPTNPEESALAQRVMAADRKMAEAHLRGAAARLSSNDFAIHTRVALSPHVAETLDELVRREAVDLVVLSAHGLSGRTSQPYGSVAASLLSSSSSPVLVLQDLPRRAITAERASSVSDRLGQLSTYP